jgi:chaperonin GroES
MIQPIRDNILVKPFDADNISEGGIIVPDSAKKPSNKVMIVAVGNGTGKKPMKLKPGMVGYRTKDWGLEVIWDNELHYLMNDEAILATN